MPNDTPSHKLGPGPGRPKGSLNPRTKAQHEFGDRMIDAAAEARLKAQFDAGTLHPSIMSLLIHYKYGKPIDRVELTGAEGGPLNVARVEIVVVDNPTQDPPDDGTHTQD